MAGLPSWECNGTTPNGQIHDNQSPQGPHDPQINFGKSCAFCGLTKEQVQSASRGGQQYNIIKAGAFAGLAGAFISATFIFPKLLANRTPPPSTATPPQSDVPVSWFNMAGSNTIGKKLAPKLVEAFMKAEGCTNIRETRTSKSFESKQHELIRISCQTGDGIYEVGIRPWGSNYALRFLLEERTADIAMMSRQVNSKDTAKFPSASELRTANNENVIGLDAIAIISSKQNSIPSLSISELRQIFSTGMDAAKKEYKLYSRDAQSGTYDTFDSLVMNKKPITSAAIFLEDSKELVTNIATQPVSLGFVSLAAAEGSSVRIVPVQGASASSVISPNRFTIKSEDYPLTRRLYFYINQTTVNQKAAKFVDFVLSPEGQKVVDANDFVSQGLMADKTLEHASMCASLVAGSEALSTKFRFETGSDQLDSRARVDLQRLKDYLASRGIPSSRVVLLGFADNVGSESRNLELSRERASSVARQLSQVGVGVGRIEAFGSSEPIAPNNSEEGRSKNRRVEVCVKP
jgi:phosphate transport system substrate-binding protein